MKEKNKKTNRTECRSIFYASKGILGKQTGK